MPQAAALGTILLRNEVVVRELDKVATCVLLIICRTCLSKSGFRKKREKNEGKYQWHVLARQDQLCLLVGGVNFARLYVEFSGSKALTNRDTLQHPSNREGERAHNLAVLYSANNNPASAIPLSQEVLTRHSHS